MGEGQSQGCTHTVNLPIVGYTERKSDATRRMWVKTFAAKTQHFVTVTEAGCKKQNGVTMCNRITCFRSWLQIEVLISEPKHH